MVSELSKTRCFRKSLEVFQALPELSIAPDTAVTNSAISTSRFFTEMYSHLIPESVSMLHAVLGICAGIPVACRAGCLNDLQTTQEREGLQKEPEAAKVAADAQAAAHQAALAQAAADGGASCEQAEQQAASRMRAAVPGDDASEEQPSLARIPLSCLHDSPTRIPALHLLTHMTDTFTSWIPCRQASTCLSWHAMLSRCLTAFILH